MCTQQTCTCRTIHLCTAKKNEIDVDFAMRVKIHPPLQTWRSPSCSRLHPWAWPLAHRCQERRILSLRTRVSARGDSGVCLFTLSRVRGDSERERTKLFSRAARTDLCVYRPAACRRLAGVRVCVPLPSCGCICWRTTAVWCASVWVCARLVVLPMKLTGAAEPLWQTQCKFVHCEAVCAPH